MKLLRLKKLREMPDSELRVVKENVALKHRNAHLNKLRIKEEEARRKAERRK